MEKKHRVKLLMYILIMSFVLLVACSKAPEDKTKELTFQEMLTTSKSLKATKITRIAVVDPPEIEVPNTVADEDGNYYSNKHTGMQGGYYDGRYFYQTFLKYCYNKSEKYATKYVNDDKNIVVIVKYDVEKKEVVKISEPMDLDHATDMTYNSKTGYLMVAHGIPNTRLISYLNPDTLEFIKIEKVSNVRMYIGGIDYDEKNDRYAVRVANSEGFIATDGKLKQIGEQCYGEYEAKAYTPQDGCCDENYIYNLFYGAGTNKIDGTKLTTDAIYVYDWDGNFITAIEVDFGDEEPENISVVDGKLYVGTLGMLYEIDGLVPAEE